jgi:hypothetical protein
VHPETIVPSAGGCGLTYHPDGSLYLNMDDGTFGIANVNADGTTRRLLGPRGNALGIAVDPITQHLVYPGRTCRPGQGPTCTLFDLDPVTGVAASVAVLDTSIVGYVDGIAFDPTGGFIFLANRAPQKRLTILTRGGVIVQHVAMTSEPIGLWFHVDAPSFVVTNNADGSISRFDFPGDVYSQPAAITTLADQGLRGDLIQAGSDRCLYVTQGGTRYDDDYEEGGTTENSIVQICGGFAVPPGITPDAPAGTLDGTVTDLATTTPLASAIVVLSDGTTTTTDGTGYYSFTLVPGTYDAAVKATGYIDGAAHGLVVSNRHTTTQDFALTNATGRLTGVVTDTTGAVLTTATITLSGVLATATDGTGTYSFTLRPGTYDAAVTAPGYNAASAAGLVINALQTTTQNFVLARTVGTLRGVVASTAGNVVAGATVALNSGAVAATDAAGRYSFTLVPGTYSATVTATNYNSASASGLAVAAGATTTKDFALGPLPGTLQGVVTSTAGGKLAGAIVTLADGTKTTTDTGGAYKFTLAPGTYGVTVTAASFNAATASGLLVASNAITTRDFSLTPVPPPDPCKKANDFFALGAAANYTLLTIGRDGCGGWTDVTLSGGTVFAGIGGLGGDTGTWMKDTTFQGTVYVDPDADWTRKTPYNLAGGRQTLNLDSTVAAAVSASKRFAGLKVTQKLTSITKTATITGSGGVNVISVTAVKIVNGTLTIKGGASDVFVINVSGKFELDASKVVLSGGVPQCAILWNFTGDWVSEANEVELENGSTGVGTFLAPHRLVDFQDSTLIGKVLAGGEVIVNHSTVKPQ